MLKTFIQAQGTAYACGKGAHKKSAMHTKGSDVLKKNDSSPKIDSKNNTYYRHKIKGCPDLAKSVFLIPTAEDPWIPNEVFCEKQNGNFTHKDLHKFDICNSN